MKVVRGVATVYKALDGNFKSPRKFDYTPGTKPMAPDWDGGDVECGNGLHFSPSPRMAREFAPEATKYCACPVALKDMAVHPDGSYPHKCKAKGCCGPVKECDEDGEPIVPAKKSPRKRKVA